MIGVYLLNTWSISTRSRSRRGDLRSEYISWRGECTVYCWSLNCTLLDGTLKDSSEDNRSIKEIVISLKERELQMCFWNSSRYGVEKRVLGIGYPFDTLEMEGQYGSQTDRGGNSDLRVGRVRE